MTHTKRMAWLEIAEKPDAFKRFLDLCRSEGVREISVGEISVKFQEMKIVAPGKLEVEPISSMSEEEKKKGDEEILYWSAGA
jgi:hypothetical protein